LNIQASAAGGNLGTCKGNVQLYGKADKLIYSVRYAKIITNGFSAAFDSTGKNNFDNDGYNGNATNANIRYKITDNFMVKAFALYSQYKADVDAALFTDDKYYTIHNNNFSTGAGF